MIYVEGDVPFYRFNNLAKFADVLRHGISSRKGGVSDGSFKSLNLGIDVGDTNDNLEENYRRFARSVGFNLRDLVYSYQSHTDNILVMREIPEGFGKPFNDVDGFITDLVGVPLMVRFADCQGVVMYDPVKRVIAAVHCGWRGNVKNILGKAVNEMRDYFECSPYDIVVGISPSLGPCCAEFTDPMQELPEAMHKYVKGRHVDLWECGFDQLVEAGVDPGNIEIARKCTVCENDEFFSYRGGKREAGHLGGVIELNP